MAYNIRLKDEDGNAVYPLTMYKNVVDENEKPSMLVEVEDFPALPYNVYKLPSGKYAVEDILATREETFTEYFVDSVSGSDTANAGTSEDAPFLTLKKALTTAANKCAKITILNDDAVFWFDDLYGEYATKKSLIIQAKTGAKIITGVKSPGFTLLSGYSNTYESADLSGYRCMSSANVYSAIDLDADNIDTMGLYVPYANVASIAEVEATAGTCYYDSSAAKMYVHPLNSVDTVHPLSSSYKFRFNLSTATENTMLYLENLNIIAGFYMAARSAASDTDTRTLEFIAKNCIFQHNIAADGIPCSNYDTAYLIDCVCGYSKPDCFNYHASNMTETQILNTCYVEVNCQAEEAGYYSEAFSIKSYINNLSTAHEGVNILRVNFTGRHGMGPMIADVNGCRSVCIDCHVFNEKYDFTAGSNMGCFTFNESSAVHAGKATCINCFGYDKRDNVPVLNSTVTKTEVRGGNLLNAGDDFTVSGDLLILN